MPSIQITCSNDVRALAVCAAHLFCRACLLIIAGGQMASIPAFLRLLLSISLATSRQ